MARMTTAQLLAYERRLKAGKRPTLDGEPAEPEIGHGGIQEQIEDYLKGLGNSCYFVRSRTDRATTNAVGTPDFLGWYHGKPFAVECKRKGAKPTIEQQGELLRARIAGATTAVVHSLAEAIEVMDSL